MFSKAVELAGAYTRPIIISKRLENGTVSSGIATFIAVNKDGWVLTAAHVLRDAFLGEQHAKERANYASQLAAINADPSTTPAKKKFLIRQLTRNPEWITNYSPWWSLDGISFDAIHCKVEPDLAIAKLNGFDKLGITNFPVFADPATPLPQGTSLCRLGFPFHEVKTTFDASTSSFKIEDLPFLAKFPNEGIMTRNVMYSEPGWTQPVHFLETSSPGLRGQSGGPVFDVNGRLWALQSRTSSLPLGFAPKAKINGREITEHQFMHVGWGTYVSHIRNLFAEFKIDFKSA